MTADGEPIVSPVWDGTYPCYCPPAGVPPIIEWGYPTPVPLPDCPDIPEALFSRMNQWDIMAAGNRRFMRSVLERKVHNGVLEAARVLFCGDNEYNQHAHVIGYRVDEIPYDNDMAWAWLSLHPEMMEMGGYLLMPSLSLEQADGSASYRLREYLALLKRDGFKEVSLTRNFWRGENRDALREVNRKKREFRDGQVYPNFLMQFPGWLNIAQYLFKWMGLHVRNRDIHLMLVWTWG